MPDIYGPRLAVASTAAAMASATVSAEAGMTGETVAKAAMEPMVTVMMEVAKAAIVKIERAARSLAVERCVAPTHRY